MKQIHQQLFLDLKREEDIRMKKITSIILCIVLTIATCCQNNLTLYAEETPAQITCESKECYPGDELTLNINISNNVGLMYLEVTPEYSNELGEPDVKNGNIMTDFTKGKQFIWTEETNITNDGILATLTFDINSSVAPGKYFVNLVIRSAYNYDEKDVSVVCIPATIIVKERPVPVKGVSLDKNNVTVETSDESITLIAEILPENATNKKIVWTSSNNEIATVSNGIVRLIKKGIVTITATTEDGNFSASCVVEINCSHRISHYVPLEMSTCIKHGHKAYTVCDECGEIVDGSDELLPLAEHIGGIATCKNKAVCDVCHKEYGEYAQHNFDNIVKDECIKTKATCISKAIYYKSCSVCGEKSTETFEYGDYDYSNHVGLTNIRNKKEATCCENGYTGDVWCDNCNRIIEKGTDILATGNHVDSDNKWKYDNKYHYHMCYFGTKFDVEEHIASDWIVDMEATTTSEGRKHKECIVCKYILETEIISKEEITETENSTTREEISGTESLTTKQETTEKENSNKETSLINKEESNLKPGKITKLTLKNKKAGKLLVKFKQAKNANKYIIKYTTDRKFKKRVKTKNTSKLSYTLKKLIKGKVYYVKVCGINGNTKGNWSKTKKIRIKI